MILLKNIVNKFGLLMVAIGFFASDVSAWSRQGHYEIAITTFNSLDDSSKVYLRLRLHALNAAGADLKNLGDVSVLADKIKEMPMQEVFHKYGEVVPQHYESEQLSNTKHWHYQDVIINDKKSKCDVSSKGALITQLNAIKEMLMDPESRLSIVQESILWAFAIHLIEDIHQPLHTMSRVNGDCESDLGGNKVCVTRTDGKCELNLHQYWDRGFGVFDEPLVAVQLDNFQLAPESWAQEGLAHAEAAYAKRNDEYEMNARAIVKTRAELAAARSAKFIETVISFKKSGKSNLAVKPQKKFTNK